MEQINDRGLFMQWLPTYQLTKADFEIIVKTMLAVFPQVTVWRGDFAARKPIIGLLGHKQTIALSAYAGIIQDYDIEPEKVSLMAHYVGNLSMVKDFYDDISINTDNYPVIEFSAPVNQRQTKSGDSHWFAGEQLIDFMQQLRDALPIADDVYLKAIPTALKL